MRFWTGPERTILAHSQSLSQNSKECDYSWDAEQTIELEYDSQYTDNIKFKHSDDLCLSGSNNYEHEVYAEPCGGKHQHWSF